MEHWEQGPHKKVQSESYFYVTMHMKTMNSENNFGQQQPSQIKARVSLHEVKDASYAV